MIRPGSPGGYVLQVSRPTSPDHPKSPPPALNTANGARYGGYSSSVHRNRLRTLPDSAALYIAGGERIPRCDPSSALSRTLTRGRARRVSPVQYNAKYASIASPSPVGRSGTYFLAQSATIDSHVPARRRSRPQLIAVFPSSSLVPRRPPFRRPWIPLRARSASIMAHIPKITPNHSRSLQAPRQRHHRASTTLNNSGWEPPNPPA